MLQHISCQHVSFFLGRVQERRVPAASDLDADRSLSPADSREHPIQTASRAGQPVKGERPFPVGSFPLPGSFFQHLFRFRKLPGEDQLFLCTGHGHIEHPQLLPQIFQHDLPLDDLFQKGGDPGPPFQIHRVDPYAPFRMDDHAAPHILGVEPLAHACHKHDRKFQALTLMDAHDPHRIGLFVRNIGLPVVHIVFLKLLDITHKIEQSFVATPFKCRRLFHQHLQVGRTLFAPRHCGNIQTVPGVLHDLPEQLMDCRKGNHIPKMLQLPVKCVQTPPQLLPLVFFPGILHPPRIHILLRGFIKCPFRSRRAELRHLPRVQTCKRRRQHRR